MSFEDRRKHGREEVYNKAVINDEILGYIRDISKGGLRVSVMKFEPVDLEGTVIVKILSKEIIKEDIILKCSIRWEKSEGLLKSFGLELSEIVQGDSALVEKYINYIQNIDIEDTKDIVVEITELDEEQ
jgi:hypothetical protein